MVWIGQEYSGQALPGEYSELVRRCGASGNLRRVLRPAWAGVTMFPPTSLSNSNAGCHFLPLTTTQKSGAVESLFLLGSESLRQT